MKNKRSQKYLKRKARVREFYRIINDPNTKITFQEISEASTRIDKEFDLIYIAPIVTSMELD